MPASLEEGKKPDDGVDSCGGNSVYTHPRRVVWFIFIREE
jgi:hypothetical protein